MTEVVLLQYLICGVVYCGKGRDWLLRRPGLLRLTPFPYLAGRLLANWDSARSWNQPLCFYIAYALQISLCASTIKTKRCRNIDISLLRLFCGKGGIRTPGTVTRTPHFECGPIDHSGTFPVRFAVANVRIYFLIPTISSDILHFFCENIVSNSF